MFKKNFNYKSIKLLSLGIYTSSIACLGIYSLMYKNSSKDIPKDTGPTLVFIEEGNSKKKKRGDITIN